MATPDTETPRILIVDDEPSACQSMESMLLLNGYSDTLTCTDSRQAMPLFDQHDIDLVLLDLMMPHITGEELLEQIGEYRPHVPVIVITGVNEIQSAVRCVKLGAFDYQVKPIESESLLNSISLARERMRLTEENERLRSALYADTLRCPQAFEHIVTGSQELFSAFKYMEAVAASPAPLLITGETGVGKDMLARAMRTLMSHEQPVPYVAENIAALPDGVFSDTLFGHLRGAFTGAETVRKGLIEQAGGGILFLDEIGDLERASQVNLLRLLQEGEYRPLGSDQSSTVQCRFILSTNRDIQQLVETGEFRKDLYHRLRRHHVHVPPLRERLDTDLPPLLAHFLDQAANDLGKKRPPVPEQLIDLLKTYSFPGNVRELQSMVHDAVAQHEKGTLSLRTFREYITPQQGCEEPGEARAAASSEGMWVNFGGGFPTLKEANDQLIDRAMEHANGNQSIAAQLLGISQQALSQRLKRRRQSND